MIEFTLSNQGGIEMLKMCNKEWGVLERFKYMGYLLDTNKELL